MSQRTPGKLRTSPGLPPWSLFSKTEISILPARYLSRSQIFFFFHLRALLSTAEWLGWGRCTSRTFHSAGGGLSITRCVTPFNRAGGGGGDAPSGKRKRVRRRRRCSLSSSAETFSACCREHGPRERTGAATIALPLDGLGAHLAKSIFPVMPAVYFVLNGYWLKYKICTYSVSGTQPPALPAIFSIYRLQRRALSPAPFPGLLSRTGGWHDGGRRWQVPWASCYPGSCYLVLSAGMCGFQPRKDLNTISQLLQERFTVRLA